jgi:hypothetical protein
MRYIFKFILCQIIGFDEVEFCTNLTIFEASNLAKINYSHHRIGNYIWIAPNPLLFETGLKDQEIKVFNYHDTKAFFATVKTASMPFDIFSAAFYLMSRYEEYLPSIRDKHDRFDAKHSLAYKENFLHQAVVDRWAIQLEKLILEKHNDLQLKKRTYSYINTIDIDNAWAYKHKGIFRTWGAIAKDVTQLGWTNFIERIMVFLGKRRDMYDTYHFLFELQNKYNYKSIYFFLFGDYGKYDRNVSSGNKEFRALIKSIADDAEIGIHPSYSSNKNLHELEIEIKRLGKVIKRDITKSRNHFLKLSFPTTYERLLEHDITDDYTMGYANAVGFRAGTSVSFPFYNIDLEQETKLLVHPFAVMDATLLYYLKLTPEEGIALTKQIIEEVKSVQGTFISLWHNETVSDSLQWKGWKMVYEKMIEAANT